MIFLDEKFDQLYQSEQRQGTLFTAFSGIAIFIACLGLLGLSAFSISQRLKEIGIRKVLGASTGGIVQLLSLDFLKLIGIAALIAFIVAFSAILLLKPLRIRMTAEAQRQAERADEDALQKFAPSPLEPSAALKGAENESKPA